MSFMLFEIAKHPDIQSSLHDEIVSLVGDEKDVNIDLNTLQKMTYMDIVLKELLRMYPSAPFIEREIQEDVELGEFPSQTIQIHPPKAILIHTTTAPLP